MTKSRATTIAVSMAASLYGCAFYPVMNSQQDFKPANVSGIPCDTQMYTVAMRCAGTLGIELSDLTKGVHEYNLFHSYSAWFLGAVTGGVLAFDGGKGALKGLAVSVGSLIGLTAVVKPEEQRKIASSAQTELRCIVSVAEAVRNAQLDPLLNGVAAQSQAAVQRIDAASENAVAPFINVGGARILNASEFVNLFKNQEQGRRYRVMAQTAQVVAGAVGAEPEIGGKLSVAVLSLRQRVRDQLSANSAIDDSAADKQRDLVVGMGAEIVKKRADLRKQQEAISGSGAAPYELAILAATTALNGTAGIDTALSECVDSATIEALKK